MRCKLLSGGGLRPSAGGGVTVFAGRNIGSAREADFSEGSEKPAVSKFAALGRLHQLPGPLPR
jgi:hypothetical protein